MKTTYTVPLDTTAGDLGLASAGGKGASLARLASAGLPVPGGFILTTAAYRRFVDANELQPQIAAALAQVEAAPRPSTLQTAAREIHRRFAEAEVPPEIAEAVADAYTGFDSAPPVAVRSSATAEDLPELSFAGQQETFLNVRGIDAIQAAVKRCWASLWTAQAIDYRMHHDVPQDVVDLAVVVQRLVNAEVAGIMFTANPVNGRRDEVVINAAWGLGEAIVSGVVSPDTIVADKADGYVKHIDVADKEKMTVTTPDGTEEQPVPMDRRKSRTLNDAEVAELVNLGRRIEALYNGPQDIEWCRAQGTFFILQARPITTLERAATPATAQEVPPPSEWPLPNPKGRYMRNNIVELIPGPMTPLFATLGRQIINTHMNQVLTTFMGKPGLVPEEIVVPIQGYAYYNGEFTPKQIGGILLRSMGIMKRMFSGAEQRWVEARARYEATVAAQATAPWRTLPATEILARVPNVLGAAIDYYMALLSGMIPAAWITEAIFTGIYSTLIKRRNDPRAPIYLLGFDSIPIYVEKALYDLAQWALGQPELAAYLLQAPTPQLVSAVALRSPSGEGSDAPADAVPGEAWQAWRTRFRAHLAAYGGMIYDLDFAKPTPADDPAPVIETFKLFLRGEGTDPHVRQAAAAERREAATAAMVARLKGLRLKLFRKRLAPAQRYAPQREDGLATLGLGYPLVRAMLLEIGQRLADVGAVAIADDIFWLEGGEVTRAVTALDSGEIVTNLEYAVGERKALWKARKQVIPPVALPVPPKLVQKLMPAMSAGADGQHAPGSIIKGTACSPGIVTATARVLLEPEDFDTMSPGEVLVAAITTPAWTPLFAMASAVVTDIGGPLSHGSIVAREYGIPAVLGTGGATRRIKSGDRVRVDGTAGKVEILEAA